MAKNNIAQIVESWGPAIKQLTNNSVNESNYDKFAWMCEYAHNHTMAKLNEEAVGGVSFPYNTLNNTLGVGNPVPAQQAGMTAADQASPLSNGSGDKWPALLPMALQVAARTIGFDLVNTIPFQGPTGVLPFLDYVYSGSKDAYGAAPAVSKETANPKIGVNGVDPAYKLYDLPHAFRCKLVVPDGSDKTTVVKNIIDTDASTGSLVIKSKTGVEPLKVQFIGLSRLHADLMFRVLPGQTGSLAELFDVTDPEKVTLGDGTTAQTEIANAELRSPRLISALEDQVQGFTGSGKYDSERWGGTFQDPKHLYEPMDRATGEMQYPRQMSLKVFTKFVSVGTQSVAVAVTQEQVQDLQKQWGIDVLKMVENAAINELSQSINKHILSRLFALGWKNHYQAYESEGINLNMDLTTAGVGGDKKSFATYDDNGQEVLVEMPVNKPQNYGQFENAETTYKKVATNILAAGNVIMQRGRRGAANFAVTNWKIATMLQSNAQYAFSPIANTLSQNNGALYPAGSLAGLTLYVDPMMHSSDTRVLVGRKGDKDEPGVVFCPYIMAESVRLIAEGTAAPKVLIKSRYALVDLGWYPQLSYLTFYVNTPEGML